MTQVLALIASPRKLGNCEIMAKAIAGHIPQPSHTRFLRLHDFRIKPCLGCYRCLFKDQRCIIDDDLGIILEALSDADALIVAAPTYFLGANGMLKLFLDRGLSFYGRGDRLWNKPAVGVGIAGIPGKEGATLLGIEGFLKLTLCRIKALRMVYGALPGEIFLNEGNRCLAADLGRALLGPEPRPASPGCPVCGGTTFQFLSAGNVRCMVCSNAGSLESTPGGPVVRIAPGEHEFFRSTRDARAHETWLRQMKQRFFEHKKELKQISKAFRGDWDWVKPPVKDTH